MAKDKFGLPFCYSPEALTAA
ncbi:hypothetical protein CCACVL1_06054 [Corchorus capsularis]|uniref:Uncharacterized protein n=1 Tax=Corchorus capsularis TaxID=210143 RepID=A0A1R3JHN7_COCAP|nr:hypothetical protein CCACVL1_06054 [Corchorus capsularis]